MNTEIYLLAIITLLYISCKDKKADTEQVNTSLDSTIQQIAENALNNQIKELNADAGIVIILESETGSVKAIASNNISENEAIEFGNLFSTISMLIALNDNIVSSDDEIDTDNGTYEYSGYTIRDHSYHRGGYGTITAKQAILFSSNVGMAKIILNGYESNPHKFYERLNQFGFTYIPKIEDWQETTLPWLAFGYNVKISPLQMVEFYNSIANGSVKCSPSSLAAIRKMLLDVVNDETGTGQYAKSDKVLIAGKTGMVQMDEDKHRVSFCGYFPFDNPKYSCIVVIENPKEGSPSGGRMAGSVVKEIAENINSNIND